MQRPWVTWAGDRTPQAPTFSSLGWDNSTCTIDGVRGSPPWASAPPGCRVAEWTAVSVLRSRAGFLEHEGSSAGPEARCFLPQGL